MKAVGGLVVLVALAVGGWWAFQSVVGHDSCAVPIAFGFPKEGMIEMQAVASMAMTVTEPPRMDPATAKLLWEEWVEQHFELRDPAGNRLKLSLQPHSDMVPKHKIMGTPEGYLAATLRPGTTYTFDYIPKRAEPKRYRHTFTAPAADREVERIAFKPI